MTIESRTLLFCLLFAVHSTGWATVIDPGDPLARWLDAEVVPQLAETLGRHPNFRGEAVGFVTLVGGVPQSRSNALNGAIEQYLRQRLLARGGVQLVLDGRSAACGVPRPVNYALGIEVTTEAARQARVSLLMLDLDAGVWVSGISHEWRGRLTAAQGTAAGVTVNRTSAGSIEKPLVLSEVSSVADALGDRLRCALPRGVDGTLYMATPDDARLARIALALRRELMRMPVAVLTERSEGADWILRFELAPAGPGLSELTLEFDLADSRQRLAAVFVTGDAAGNAPVRADRVARLLSPLAVERADRVGICRDRRGARCAELSFEVLEPAYLLAFTIQDQRVELADCRGRVQRAERGERRFRLPVGSAVDAGSQGADIGFYVFAVKERRRAEQLRRVLEAAPGACGSRSARTTATWLARFESVFANDDDPVQWAALHLDAELGRL